MDLHKRTKLNVEEIKKMNLITSEEKQKMATQNRLSYGLDELAELTGLSIGFFRKEIRAKKLAAKLFGSRVLVMADNWEEYVRTKPEWDAGK